MSIADDSYYEYTLWRHWNEIKKRRKTEPEWVKNLLNEEPLEEQKAADDLVKQYLEASLDQSGRAVMQLEREVYVLALSAIRAAKKLLAVTFGDQARVLSRWRVILRFLKTSQPETRPSKVALSKSSSTLATREREHGFRWCCSHGN